MINVYLVADLCGDAAYDAAAGKTDFRLLPGEERADPSCSQNKIAAAHLGGLQFGRHEFGLFGHKISIVAVVPACSENEQYQQTQKDGLHW